ncbi:peptide-binding protein [Streptomyces abyssalis]|uniref:Peptide-binding protein n=1 Tax=Streptomyces abyssalis TaxID=933944 RepID=A0A1E7JUK9_9ACTN|nr:ABC transporter substrate-binding protein [Streptomyces abyssalis]OEU89392.1 peptide-binding protein [Streptomyces abyssalis]OEU93637.1 peptide-binding protein [Streptomyces abyssalis]OEV29984.1 peptide-binding protein [Streptomyces nanshensis]
MHRKTPALTAAAGLLASLLTACGQVTGDDAEAIVVGTTDTFTVSKASPAPFDPAAAYDVSSWNVMRNAFQTLLRMPRSGTRPVRDAAERCGFTDERNEQYRCTLREGLTFSNGNTLDAKDVEYSIERILRIRFANGPASLLTGIAEVEATSDREVVFNLRKPDATFPFKIATPAASIVDQQSYPADGFAKGFRTVGSGPYTLEYESGARKTVFTRNADYKGSLKIAGEKVELQSFDDSAAMEKALRAGDIDLMNRTISPQQIERLESAPEDSIDLVQQPGQEIRYLVFNTDDETAGRLAVRRAMAEVIDRESLVRDVYARTAEPLYSLVPSGVPGHRNSFFNKYGEGGADSARRTLRRAGVSTPVKLELAYTTDHYGSVTKKEFTKLKEQLNGSGLFDAEVRGLPWDTYRSAALEGKYQVYGYGWFPDFPDADNYIAPFFERNNFLNSPYISTEIRDKLIPQTRQKTDRVRTERGFGRAQDIVADEVPVLPLWQGKQFIAAGEDITGAEWALNSSSVLQLWELGRSSDG